ncbi:MAG: endonuclease/exonuclease/phosphatase family protein [Salinibacter sp.]
MIRLRRILRALGRGAAALLVGAFLIGYAAPYLSPARFWWTNLFAVGLPVLGAGVAVLALGLCGWGGVRRRWGKVAVGGGLLVLLLVRFGPRGAAWAPAPAAEGVRVMTFNVPPSRSDGPPLAALVQREAPDVLALQEARLQTGRRGADARLLSGALQGLRAPSTGYRLPRGLPAATVVQQPVFGRGRLDSMSVHPLPPDGETSARSRYTRTEFAWRGRTAVLYNVHLHSVGAARPWTLLSEEWTSLDRWRTFLRTYREGSLRRAQQARLLRRRIERETAPVIVVGDFNSTPHQWAYRHVAQGLRSAVRRRVRAWGGTYPAERPLVQIDHVLASPAWQITAARIPADGVAAVSDHRPVVARLRWTPD